MSQCFQLPRRLSLQSFDHAGPAHGLGDLAGDLLDPLLLGLPGKISK
jgi:hypothetical protein